MAQIPGETVLWPEFTWHPSSVENSFWMLVPRNFFWPKADFSLSQLKPLYAHPRLNVQLLKTFRHSPPLGQWCVYTSGIISIHHYEHQVKFIPTMIGYISPALMPGITLLSATSFTVAGNFLISEALLRCILQLMHHISSGMWKLHESKASRQVEGTSQMNWHWIESSRANDENPAATMIPLLFQNGGGYVEQG